MFICFGTTHERDGWTDGRTLHADISRAYALHRAAKTTALSLRAHTVFKLRKMKPA